MGKASTFVCRSSIYMYIHTAAACVQVLLCILKIPVVWLWGRIGVQGKGRQGTKKAHCRHCRGMFAFMSICARHTAASQSGIQAPQITSKSAPGLISAYPVAKDGPSICTQKKCVGKCGPMARSQAQVLSLPCLFCAQEAASMWTLTVRAPGMPSCRAPRSGSCFHLVRMCKHM